MVRPIMKDPIFLAQPSAPATAEDLPVGQDLLDTLAAHADGCVGMAANMIGVSKRIIVFLNEGGPSLMFNPKILRRSGPYHTEEGCLSLPGRAGDQAVPLHQSGVSERGLPDPVENLHRVSCPDHPARD